MKTMRRAILLPLLCLSLGASADDQANPDQRLFQALQGRMDDLSGRMARLEDQSGSQGILSLLNQVESLESEVARLRGKLDELSHRQDMADKRQKDVMADFDARLKELHDQAPQAASANPAAPAAPEAAPAAASAPTQGAASAPASSPAVDPEAENKAYLAALNLAQASDFRNAVSAFNAFLKQYPKGSLAGNALYWLGFSYFSLGDYTNAMAAQQRLIKEFPQHPKVPDAMINMARTYIQLGSMDKASQILSQVVTNYPGTPSADTAKKIQALLK